MISVEQAWQRLSAHFGLVESEVVGLAQSWGRVTAEPVRALLTKPMVALSAMDGYALRSQANQGLQPVMLHLIGEAPAGHPFGGQVGGGECVRIFTGSPLPVGSDAVVRQEDTAISDGLVAIKVEPKAGDHVRLAGSDFCSDQVLLAAGQPMTARAVALAASAGICWIKVRRRPQIAILATGDELVMPGQLAGRADGACGRTINAVGLGLAAMVEAWGGQPIQLGIAGDDLEQLANALDNAGPVDLVVTVGGASVGDYDLIRNLFDSPGDEIDFWQVAMRPGKPLLFGRRKTTSILGLPGNPVSALVCALVFVHPLMRLLLGCKDAGKDAVSTFLLEQVGLGCPLPPNDQRQSYLRARLERDLCGRMTAVPFTRDAQDSAVLSSLAAADCLVVRGPHAPAAELGESVEIMRFPSFC